MACEWVFHVFFIWIFIFIVNTLFSVIDITFVLEISVNSSVINKTMFFDPNVCLFMFYIFHVLTFARFQTLHRFRENYTQTGA
ncbi:hypothetical protein HanIR_Chr08g0386061 [Helianthus annuus]|nr:hypothetical protein HanIR_Chr08g0386061 [Helianthus annuus]